MRNSVFVFDIDGTIADVTPAIPFWNAKDWENYDAVLVGLKPIENVVKTLLALSSSHPIVFFTARTNSRREVTSTWLRRNVGVHAAQAPLFMCNDGDERPHDELKLELMLEIRKSFEPIMIFEDQDSIVKSLRAAGYTVSHVTI